MRPKITVIPYNPDWRNQFKALESVLLKSVKNDILSIEHVGSTSVKGLAAKPIIDLDIIIEDDDVKLKNVIQKLSVLGYEHVGDLGVTGREAFKRPTEKVPDDGSGKDWFRHHLYVCKKGITSLQNHLNLRDYLRSNPAAVLEYGALKQELARQFPYNIDAYIDGKTDFIVCALKLMGMEEEERGTIERQNKIQG